MQPHLWGRVQRGNSPGPDPWAAGGATARCAANALAKVINTRWIMKSVPAHAVGYVGPQKHLLPQHQCPPLPRVAHVPCKGMGVRYVHYGTGGMGAVGRMVRSPQGGLSAGKGRLKVILCPRIPLPPLPLPVLRPRVLCE